MKRLTCFLLACLLAATIGCRSGTVDEVSETSERPVRTLPPAAPAMSSEPLRVWAPSRAEHHPLRGGDYQNRAIDRLLYEPLFDYRTDGQFYGVLADEMIWSDDGLQLTYRLRDDAVFSNELPVTARDAAVSLQTWIFHDTGETIPVDAGELITVDMSDAGTDDLTAENAPETEQTEPTVEPGRPYRFGTKAEVFAAVTSVETRDNTVTVIFSGHYDNAPGYLVFPVLPAEFAGALFAPAAPGSGPYRIQLSGDQGYLAEPVSESGLSVSIEVLAGIGEAMKRFQDGKLDLLLMDPNQYALYSGRQNVRFQGIPTTAYSYLRLDVLSGFLAVEENRELFLRILTWQQRLVENATFPHTFSPWPAGRDDRRLPFRIDEPAADNIPRTPVDRSTLRLVRGNSTYDAELGENLRLLLERFGYHVETVTTTDQNPNPLFDLRLFTFEFEAYPDPYAFIAQTEGGAFRGILTAFPEAAGTLLYMRRYLDQPDESDEALSQMERAAFGEALSIVSAELPIVGLTVPSAGIAYGNRVEGQLKTAYQSPYAGLEDLIVWPIP